MFVLRLPYGVLIFVYSQFDGTRIMPRIFAGKIMQVIRHRKTAAYRVLKSFAQRPCLAANRPRDLLPQAPRQRFPGDHENQRRQNEQDDYRHGPSAIDVESVEAILYE